MAANTRLLVLSLLCLLPALPAQAATTFNVTTTAMTIAADGQCSLVEAMSAARTNTTLNECVNSGGPPFTINLQANQTYTATAIGSTDPQFGNSAMQAANHAIEIVGNGSTITQTGQPMRLFLHNSGAFTLRNLTLTGGNAIVTGLPFGEWGGAILSVFPGAVLNLEDVTVRNNQSGLEGAALLIVAQAVANLHRVTLSNNEAAGGTGTAFQVRVDQAALFNAANITFDGPARAVASTGVNTAVRLSNATVRSSSGIAVDMYPGTTFGLRNSIVQGDCAQNGGAFTSTNNASNLPSCQPALPSPVLGNLGAWGGPTNTILPRLPAATKDAAPGCTYSSSAGNPLFADGAAIATDQRGVARTVCDMGAVESLTIAPAALPGGTFGVPYSATITQTGGAAPVTFAITAGTLPAGLTLNTTTGEISGTPMAASSPFISFRVTDANGIATDVRYQLVIARANQTITFPAQPNQPFLPGTTFTVNPLATSTSGLTVSYTSLTGGVCTTSGTSTIVKVSPGVCTLRAIQTGNSNYFAAPTVDQTVTITATAPLAPIIGTAVAGNAQVSVAFTASSNGGAAITSYTATCGAVSQTGTSSPIVVAGLANGTPYTCTVTATNAIGTSPASAASNSVTPTLSAFTGPTATGTGTATVSFTGGGAGCSFAPTGNGPMQSAYFIPLTGHPKSPPAGTAPPELKFVHGLLDFVLVGCTPGSTVTMTVTYPSPLGGAQYWKYGPTPTNPAPHWYLMPSTVSGNQVSFDIVDGGLGDDDLAANGTIVDQGGPGFGSFNGVPTLSEWAMIVMGGMLLLFGMRRMKALSAVRDISHP